MTEKSKKCIHNLDKALCWCWMRSGDFGLVNGQIVEYNKDSTIKRFLKKKEGFFYGNQRRLEATTKVRTQAREKSGRRRKASGNIAEGRAI